MRVKRNRLFGSILITGAAVLLIMLGCRNPLLNEIEDTVEVAVTPPEVLSIYPGESEENIPITLATISVTFSKTIDSTTVSSATFYVSDPSGEKISGVPKVENDTITFTPSSNLAVGTTYTVTIDGVQDTDGNSITEKYSWTFTTGIEGDSVAPAIYSVSINGPADWTTSRDVEITLDAEDNFGISQMNISNTSSFSEGNWETFQNTFDWTLPAGDGNKTVYVRLKDGSGNLSTNTGTGTVGLDTNAPIVVTFQIDGGKTGTQNSTVDIEILGEDDFGASGVDQYRMRVEGGDWDPWTDLSNGSILISDFPLTVSSNETQVFYLEIKDSAGNVSVEDTTQITLDLTAPYVDEDNSIPAAGSLAPLNQSYVLVQFDGEMEKSTISNNTVYVLKGSDKITQDYQFVNGDSAVQFSEFELTGQPYFLEQNTSYTVFVSGTVTDVAGNAQVNDFLYAFTTDFATDATAPVGAIAFDLDDPDKNATGVVDVNLQITAEDDYNGVRAVKIWGDNGAPGSFPTFESDAAWTLYVEEAVPTSGGIYYMDYQVQFSTLWNLDSNPTASGDKYIYYKFMDFANNESATAGRLKINLDQQPPTLNSILIDGGTGYSNNTNETINIAMDAVDIHSGIKYFWVDTDNVGPHPWEDWLGSLKPNFPLTNGEGDYTIYAQVEDFVTNTSGVVNSTVNLDLTDPVVTFDATDYLEVNAAVQQTSTITDPNPAVGPGPPSGIASYFWEQIDGPVGDTVEFTSDQTGTIPNPNIELPYVSAASDGSEDGTYELQVTVEDNAGNIGSDTVTFIWDTTDPGEITTITVYDDLGNPVTDSTNSTMVYTTSAQPYANWASSTGADFYVIIPWYQEFNPNQTHSWVWGVDPEWYPFWDDPTVDWDDELTYQDKNYLKETNPVVSAPPPDNPGQNDGPVFLYVTAWDNAGNRSNRSSHQMVRFFIDTLAPVINKIQDLPPVNAATEILYDGTDGEVYDPKTPGDPGYSGIPQGSGVSTLLWEQVSGPGSLTITDETTLTPLVSGAFDGSDDGTYQLMLTAFDTAGNSSNGFYTFVWDTTPPGNTVVTGPDHTPDRTPTWSWTSGGDGNGTYEYKLEDEGGNPVAPYGSWSSTTDTYFTPAGNLDDFTRYTLFVREYDDAGNYSDETGVNSSYEIWVDSSHVTAPSVTRSGDYLRHAGVRTVNWNLGSGIGEPPTEAYRYRLKDSTNAQVYPISGWLEDGADDTLVTIDFEALGLPDDVYTLEVEEYDTINFTYPTSGDEWKGLIGTSSVQIDATAPPAPTFTATPGIAPPTNNPNIVPTDSSYNITTDNTPSWYWTFGGGSDGIRYYRWRYYDELNTTYSSHTYTYSTTVTPTLIEGLYWFEVQERDEAGNWSPAATHKLEIDDTVPTLSSILLSHRASSNTGYTTEIYAHIDVTGSGSNSKTFTSSDVQYMYFWNEGGSKYGYYYNPGTPELSTWGFANGGGDTTDGFKNVYCELRDFAGNVSVQRIDGITLDTVVPTVTSFSINDDDTTSTSSAITLNSAYTGADVMRMSTDNGLTWSPWYNDSTAFSWNLNSYHTPANTTDDGFGARKVIVQYSDWAGFNTRDGNDVASHYVQRDDAIFYGTPSIRYASKGNYSTGGIYTYYDTFPSETGSTNTYRIHYANSPTGTKYYKGQTTSPSYYYSSTYTTGTLYYLFVQMYNPDIGYSNYSTYTIGYSSNQTVIYDDDDTDDTALANAIKSWITRKWVDQYSSFYDNPAYSSGMPDYTVTLVPEDEVSNTYVYPDNIIYGDPIIITPGTFWSTSWLGRIRNIADSNKGIFAMHYYGSRFIYYASFYWSSWGLGDARGSWPYDPQPTDLDSVTHRGDTRYAGTKEYYTQYDRIWHRYFYHDYLWNNHLTDPNRIELMFTTTEGPYGSPVGANRYSIYNTAPSGTSPNWTYYYADDPDYVNYYTVARQGRFVFWGYNKIPTYINGSIPFFYNTIRFLQSYY